MVSKVEKNVERGAPNSWRKSSWIAARGVSSHWSCSGRIVEDHASGTSWFAERCWPSCKVPTQHHQYFLSRVFPATSPSLAIRTYFDVDAAVLEKDLAKPDGALAMTVLVRLVPQHLAFVRLVPSVPKQHLVVHHASHDGPADSEGALDREDGAFEVGGELVGAEEDDEGGKDGEKGGGRAGGSG